MKKVVTKINILFPTTRFYLDSPPKADQLKIVCVSLVACLTGNISQGEGKVERGVAEHAPEDEQGSRVRAGKCRGNGHRAPYCSITPGISESLPCRSPACMGVLKSMTLPLERADCLKEKARSAKASDLPWAI